MFTDTVFFPFLSRRQFLRLVVRRRQGLSASGTDKSHLFFQTSSSMRVVRSNKTIVSPAHIVAWMKDGSTFKVHNPHEFVEKVTAGIYFDQTKYDSLRRQVNMYAFTRLSRGEDRGVVCHPSFVKGARYLLENIRRSFHDSIHDACTRILRLLTAIMFTDTAFFPFLSLRQFCRLQTLFVVMISRVKSVY
jgi:hypothetical protein